MILTVGIDEVGRGCLAGPVYACAVAWNAAFGPVPGVKDSKVLSAKRREKLNETLATQAFAGIGAASAEEIDTLNIWGATQRAMGRALQELVAKVETHAGAQVTRLNVIVDGNLVPDLANPITGTIVRADIDVQLQTLIGGDRIEPLISAASIVAKVTRDALMVVLDAQHPGYGWAGNAGYGSGAHMSAIQELGYTEQHRKSFEPVKSMVAAANPGASEPRSKRRP